MILTCPSCATRYMAEGSALAPGGRMVRCANCSFSWFQEPPEDMPLKALPDMADDTGEPAALTTEAKRTGGVALVGQIAGWAALLLAVSVTVFGAYQYRVPIVRLWPQTASLYEVFGLTVNRRGLVFQNLKYDHELLDGAPVLTVSGEVLNATDAVQTVPPLRISLRDQETREILDWTFWLPVRRLEPATAQNFVTRLGNPPVEAQDVVITFGELADMTSAEADLEPLE